jgi:hypothetical protein
MGVVGQLGGQSSQSPWNPNIRQSEGGRELSKKEARLQKLIRLAMNPGTEAERETAERFFAKFMQA